MKNKELPKVPVIYKIVNKSNGSEYVGATINPSQRRRRHFKDLRNGAHHSYLMQKDFDDYGLGVFDFIVIEVTTKSDMNRREQFFIDTVSPYYNNAKIVGSTIGVRHSSDSVEKNRARNSGYGNGNAKITKEIELEMVKLLNIETTDSIARKFGVHVTTVQKAMSRAGAKKEKKVYSEDSRAKLSEIAKKRRGSLNPRSLCLVEVDIDGKILNEFQSMTAAAMYVGVNVSTMSQAIKEDRRCAGRIFKKRDAAMLVWGR